jgi:phosphocarrier protein FPr
MSLLHHFYKKQVTTLTVTSKAGFHLRPAAQFATLAKTFHATIEAHYKQKSVSAKSVNSLIGLGLTHSDSFRLTAKGKDGQEALHELQTLFHQLMVEDTPLEKIHKEHITYTSTTLQGDIIAEGIAIGVTTPLQTTTQYTDGCTFSEAINQTKQKLHNQKGAIFQAQLTLLESLEEHHHIKTLKAFEKEISIQITTLKGTPLETKRVDYLDLLEQVKQTMGYTTTLHLPKEPSILVTQDLLPSHIESLKNSTLLGVVLQKTSLTSHTAILLRAAGIPSLILNHTITPHTPAILDATAGSLILNPTQKDTVQAKDRRNAYLSTQKSAYENRFKTAMTQQGKEVHIMANIADLKSAKEALTFGAKRVGLFRTEFLFKTKPPTFQQQVNAYKEIFALFESTTIRTLDIGGDKALPYITLPPENNPFLGIRGVRLFKTHADIMQEQLLAILTAAQGHKVKVMFPMVSCVIEFQKLKALAKQLATTHNLDIPHIEFGIMIEVPSVLFLLEAFNEVVDFYSIGTNDLTQYLFAIERTHPTLSTNPLSSVVFDAIEHITQRATKPVSICGELAGDTKATEKLIKVGVTKLSMRATAIPEIKSYIRSL